jgi:hypothetical protein
MWRNCLNLTCRVYKHVIVDISGHGNSDKLDFGSDCGGYIRWCSCRWTVTRRVSHVVQEPSWVPEFTSVFSGLRVAPSFVFCVVFCRLLFVLLSFFFWPLYCLSFDLRLLGTPLIYSIFSYIASVLHWLILSNYSISTRHPIFHTM